ncbi:protein Mpv17-like [Hydractinia symbiolongicarpus]|uniref:protein Mpv17-like n=1 Tax=Hydractinia symbiolongicarpus TaxID=13093 RepID=UPI00254B19C6|nr:protein Mpv17-like [Hydractinia symbiolongicarpus]
MSILRSFAGYYIKAISTHPWKTTALATGLLCGTGDIIAQQVVERHGIYSHDTRRTTKLFAMGLFFIGPGLRSWYVVLDRLVIGTSSSVVIKKVLLDQGIWAPTFIAAFFTVSDVIDGKSFGDIRRRLQHSYIPALQANYMLWPWVQLANFYFIPVQHRVIVVNFVALFWNTYLAWAVNKNIDNVV